MWNRLSAMAVEIDSSASVGMTVNAVGMTVNAVGMTAGRAIYTSLLLAPSLNFQ